MKRQITTDYGGSAGSTAIIIIMASILIGAIVASVVSSGTTGSTTEEDLAEQAEQVLYETLDEITTYIQIKESYGKYYGGNGQQKIEKIAIEIKSLISKNIDISDLTIKLLDGETIKTLFYNNTVEPIESNSVFGHPIWNNMDENNFGLIVIHDNDNSLVNYSAITENSDRAYLIIRLPDDMAMSKGETLLVKLVPAVGITRSIELKAPLPIKPVIVFE